MMRTIVGPPGVVAPSSPGSGVGETTSVWSASDSVRVTVAGASLLTVVSMLVVLSRRVGTAAVTAQYVLTRA